MVFHQEEEKKLYDLNRWQYNTDEASKGCTETEEEKGLKGITGCHR